MSTISPTGAPSGRLRLRLALAGVVVWCLALAALTLFTANPAFLSSDQLRRSDAVVVGECLDADRNRIRIIQVLSGELTGGDELDVPNLPAAAGVRPQTRSILPLTRVRGDFVVTTLDGQQSAPLVYPATPEWLAQAQRILEEQRR